MAKVDWKNRDLIKRVVENSKSIDECLRTLQLRQAGSNHLTAKRYIQLHQLDTSHFETQSQRAIRRLDRSRKPIEHYLIKSTRKFCGNQLKPRLFKEGVLKEECIECGQGPVWNGKPLTLQLDHINGDSLDHRRENLQVLCPNCHTQTSTWGTKGPVKPPYDRHKSKFDKRKVIRPTLEILRVEVDELGFSGTGRRYGVSDNAVRNWFKWYGVEIPRVRKTRQQQVQL